MSDDVKKLWLTKLWRWMPLFLGLAAFIYYAFMCVRAPSWVFVSSDSSVWLASAIKWMVPAPYGGPVYLILSHLVSAFSPSNLPAALSISLSALPSAITVVLTYLIVLKLTSKRFIALVCAVALTGSAIFLVESTVGLYHAMAITFLTAAFYTYLYDHKYWTVILLALGVAVHIMILPITLFWLIADGRYKYWVKPILVFIGVTTLCYCFILLLMYLPTPRFTAGGFNIPAIRDFFTKTSQAIVGELSIFEAPKRIWLTIRVVLMSFGLALVPIALAFKKPISKPTLLLLSTVLFVVWYFVTCLDIMTWAYLAFMTPSAIILAGIGLSKLPAFHTKAVLASAAVLVILAPIFLNANVLTEQNPEGVQYLQELAALPQNSIVVDEAGAVSLALFYYINSTPSSHIMPLISTYLDYRSYYPMPDYIAYIKQRYYSDLDYSSTLAAVQSALSDNIPVYYPGSPIDPYYQCFTLQIVNDSMTKDLTSITMYQITGLTGLQPKSIVVMMKGAK